MIQATELLAVLQQQQVLGRQILELVEAEAAFLAQGGTGLPKETSEAKQRLLPELDRSLASLRRHREAWQKLPPDDKARAPQVTGLLRSTQDLLMKVILRDRENEQRLLRLGGVPASQLSKVQSPARPNYVAGLYQRNQG